VCCATHVKLPLATTKHDQGKILFLTILWYCASMKKTIKNEHSSTLFHYNKKTKGVSGV